MRELFALLVVVSINTPVHAQAKIVEMKCNNGTHNFLAVYDETTRTFSENETNYLVLGIEKTSASYVVFGLTVNQGPTFRATFRPLKKIEYYEKSELVQTDHCH